MVEKNYFYRVGEAGKFLREKVKISPKLMLVLSGGLTKFLDNIEDAVTVSAVDIPHFPHATAEGHSGKMVFGKIGGLPLVVLQGRFHYYEGHPMESVVFPTFVMNELGAKILMVTNATGGINASFKAGDIMLITDHINFMGVNPLVGITIQRPLDQFPDMTNAYSERLQDIAREAACERGVELKEGVYIACSGPSYETKTEIKAFRTWGADTIGMSVVPEITAANYLKMETLGFSCIANMAADLHGGGMNHHEVLAVMRQMEGKLVDLLLAVVKRLK